MEIRLQADTTNLDRWMERFPAKLRYAIAYRINSTVDRLRNQVLFPRLRSLFTIRSPETDKFFFGTPERPGGAAGKFPRASRATPDRPWAEFGTAAMERKRWGGKGGPVLLPLFETGEMRRPMVGDRSIAVPIVGRPARPELSRPVPKPMSIAALKFQAHYHGARIVRKTRGRHRRGLSPYYEPSRYNFHGIQGIQWKGLQRTFTLQSSEHQPLGGIYQRIGPGTWDRGLKRTRGGIQEIYRFIPPFALDTRLHYEDTVRAEAPRIFREEMELAWVDAIQHEDEKALKNAVRRALGDAT